MKLIIGLGNPGKKYSSTYHNLGWQIIDLLETQLACRAGDKPSNLVPDSAASKKFLAETWAIKFKQEKILLAKPQTFMNNSGLAVKKLKAYYRLTNDKIWVIYDDLNLPLGKIRIKTQGSSGGHLGVLSIINRLQGDNFIHFRLGIGPNTIPAERYVLAPVKSPNKNKIKIAQQKMVEAIITALTSSLEQAMNLFN